jgi:acetyltransferase-like isoleucine patch superfamily enzyme
MPIASRSSASDGYTANLKKVLAAFFLILPWPLRRVALVALFGYKIHPTARIGLSIIWSERLEMDAGARIGHLTMCKGLALLKMGEKSSIGNLNWISGFPSSDRTFFSAEFGRRPELILGAQAAVTNRHFLDCTNSVQIGRFTTFAGIRSQILTHGIDFCQSQQSSKPVTIGEYCFIGTGSVLLAGCVLPDYSVLGASSLLNKQFVDPYFLYAGNPAKPVKPLPKEMGYFTRSTGFVY